MCKIYKSHDIFIYILYHHSIKYNINPTKLTNYPFFFVHFFEFIFILEFPANYIFFVHFSFKIERYSVTCKRTTGLPQTEDIVSYFELFGVLTT